jgi:PIN domain
MSKKLNIFIDTSIFYKNGFSVDRKMFNTLRSLCEAKRINLITTDITDSEIQSNIEKSIKELKNEFKRIAKKNRIIETIGGNGYDEFVDSKSTQSTVDEIKDKIDSFLKSCNATVINASEQSASQVIKDYFNKKPPFGEGKKKHEFPDALILNSLKEWCSKNNKDIITISADSDFKKFCQQEDKFEHFNSLYEFINHALMDEDNVVAVIHEILDKNSQILLREIDNEIKHLGVYIGDAEGDVTLDRVISLSIIDSSVINIEKNVADVVCQLDITLSFEASYWDPDSWMSVKDDGVKEIIYHNRIEGEVEREFNIEVEFEVVFDPKKSKLIKINDVVVNSGHDLEYNHYDFEEYY